jgi:hypothetical protein
VLFCTFRYRTAAHLHLMEAAAAQLDVSETRMLLSARWLFVVAVLLAAGACLPIPHPHVERPRVKLLVTDSVGRGIPGAHVRVYLGTSPAISYNRSKDLIADSLGIAAGQRTWYWHPVWLLVADAESGTPSGWCVDAPGFVPVARSGGGSGAIAPSVVLAAASDSVTVCPDAPIGIQSLEMRIPTRGRLRSRPAP